MFGIILVVMIFSMKMISPSSDVSTSSSSKYMKAGEEGRLIVQGSDIVTVFDTKSALAESTKFANAGDEEGYSRVVYTQGFIVDSGTRVLVIENSVTSTRVKILEGTNQGKYGWVPYEWVR